MITSVGKLLVLLNAFLSIAILSWAVSAYLNRQDPEQAVDERGEKLTDKVKRLNGELNTAQAAIGPAYAAVTDAEGRLADIRRKIAARDTEALRGGFYDIFDNPRQGEALPADPANPFALDRLRRINWGRLPAARQIRGADGAPLKGVEVVSQELQDEGGKIAAFSASIKKSIAQSNALSLDIQAFNARTTRLARILAGLEEETAFLADQQVNWTDQTATLRKRNTQLGGRLKDLGTGPVAAAAAPLPALTLNTR